MNYPKWLGVFIALVVTGVWAFTTVTTGVDPILTGVFGMVAGAVLGIDNVIKRRNGRNNRS